MPRYHSTGSDAACAIVMGYDLYITRAKSWADSANHQISSDEWLAYIERDPELMPFPDDGPYFARWNGKSKYPDPWLD